MIKQHGGNIHKFAREHHFDVEQILDYSANINPFGMSKKIEEKLPEILNQALNYPDPDYKELKNDISMFEGVDEKYILLGNGAIECIFLLAEYLKSEHIMIPAPTFVEYERAFEKYETCITYYNINKTFEFDVEDYINSITEDVDTLILCNPNNPTGYLTDRSDLLLIIEYAKCRNIKVIIDEAFIDFTSDEDANTLKTYLEDYSNLIILKSLTKFFAMPGLRLGYLMTSDVELLASILDERMPWAINSFAAECGRIGLNDVHYIKETKMWIKTEREWLYDQLNRLDCLEVYKSEGNYLFFYSKINKLDEKLEKYGIMIRNCNNYRNLSDGFYRVAIKKRESNIQLVESIGEIDGNN